MTSELGTELPGSPRDTGEEGKSSSASSADGCVPTASALMPQLELQPEMRGDQRRQLHTVSDSDISLCLLPRADAGRAHAPLLRLTQMCPVASSLQPASSKGFYEYLILPAPGTCPLKFLLPGKALAFPHFRGTQGDGVPHALSPLNNSKMQGLTS